MSKRKPWFKAQIGYSAGGIDCITKRNTIFDRYRVRITDARELTPEKAVERVLQLSHNHNPNSDLDRFAKAASMTAAVVNGKVSVRKIKP